MLRAAVLVSCLAACSRSPSDAELVQKLTEQKPLELPLPPSNGTTLQRAPVIIVTTTDVTYQGRFMASVDGVVKDPRALDPLAHALQIAAAVTTFDLVTGRAPPELVQACHDAQRGYRPSPGAICPAGLAILQADQVTDMRVINAVVDTARRAGYDNLLFAVKNKP